MRADTHISNYLPLPYFTSQFTLLSGPVAACELPEPVTACWRLAAGLRPFAVNIRGGTGGWAGDINTGRAGGIQTTLEKENKSIDLQWKQQVIDLPWPIDYGCGSPSHSSWCGDTAGHTCPIFTIIPWRHFDDDTSLFVSAKRGKSEIQVKIMYFYQKKKNHGCTKCLSMMPATRSCFTFE